ncbi:LysM peptidoglycan-binding domain-containing protein, partial [Enterocloster sp.]
MKIYVVKQGDSVDSIAESQGIPVETLVWANQIEYPYRLAVGQALYISDGETGEGRRPLFSSGYAYPFIDSGVLEDTLPYLSAINVFSYGFTEDGNLVLPMTDDAWMIERALQWGVRPVLTLTPLGEDGHFNNNLVSALVRSQENQQRLIWELGRTMQEKGYEGLDIDFEYVLAEDRVEYADFVRRATQVLNIFGYTVTVALAPKTSAQQRGLLYEGIDYRLLGEAAN